VAVCAGAYADRYAHHVTRQGWLLGHESVPHPNRTNIVLWRWVTLGYGLSGGIKSRWLRGPWFADNARDDSV